VVAVLKLLYAPLGLVLLVAALVEHRGTPSARPGRLAMVAAWSVGSAVPVGAVVGYAAAHGVLPLAVYSTFTAPREGLATGLVTVAGLATMARALLLATTLVGPLALLAVWSAAVARRLAREGGLVAWVLGAAVFAAPQLPTTYRVLVMLPPVGLLAVLGLERLVTAASRRSAGVRWAGTAALAVLVMPLLPGVVRLGEAGAVEGWSLSDGARLAVGDRIGGSPMVERAAVMRGDVRPGSAIYVLGDPVVYRVLGASQAIEMNGWGPEIMSDRMWDEVVRELDRSRPEWVFVQEDYQPYVDRRPALLRLLGAAYRPVESPGAGGRWWRTDEPARPAPSPGGNQLAVNRR
jgi:hypothetical protein